MSGEDGARDYSVQTELIPKHLLPATSRLRCGAPCTSATTCRSPLDCLSQKKSIFLLTTLASSLKKVRCTKRECIPAARRGPLENFLVRRDFETVTTVEGAAEAISGPFGRSDYIVLMENKHTLQLLSDDELLRRLTELLRNSRRVEAELIAHIAEVDRRRLYARHASSLFVYCAEVLHLSEAEAYLRIEVARASRKYPVLLEMLADGRLHLSGIATLAPILTQANIDSVLTRATHKTKQKIKELVAELAPKPDIPDTVRKLPERRRPVEATPTDRELRLDGVDSASLTPPPQAVPTKPSVVEPIAPARYQVSFTAGAELRDKLERLQALMRSSGESTDLASVIEAAVTEKLEKLEAKRYGTTKSPRKSLEETDTSPSSRNIPAPVRRAVYERDRGRCRYVDPTGRRCTETKQLEFHHIRPYGRGGDHRFENICLLCRAHNALSAERDYGKEVMNRFRSSPSRVSERAAVYTFSNRATLPS